MNGFSNDRDLMLGISRDPMANIVAAIWQWRITEKPDELEGGSMDGKEVSFSVLLSVRGKYKHGNSY